MEAGSNKGGSNKGDRQQQRRQQQRRPAAEKVGRSGGQQQVGSSRGGSNCTALCGREYGICSQLLARRAVLTVEVCHGAGTCPIRMGLPGRGRR